MAERYSRYGRLKPYTWPQDQLQIPGGGGRFMPPVEIGNVDVARQEAFTMSTTIAVPSATADGTVFNTTILTDQDGDFWCDQIGMTAWIPTVQTFNTRGPQATIAISDLRTGRSLTYPAAGMPTNFLMNFLLFSANGGFDPGSSPLPDGFRSTSTIPQAFCFTRQGGIQIALSIVRPLAVNCTVDIAFSGWKEYAYASGS